VYDSPEVGLIDPLSTYTNAGERADILSPFDARDQAFCLDPPFLHRLTTRGAFHGKTISPFWIFISDRLLGLSRHDSLDELLRGTKMNSALTVYDLSLDTY
jgi:hypothetical protein